MAVHKKSYFCENKELNYNYMSQPETTTPKNNHKISIIIGIVAIVVISVLGYLYFQNKTQMESLVTEMEQEKDMLTYEYQNLALDYDSLKTNSDTLNLTLEKERQKIAQLIEEIQTVKATNASKIREYKKELSSMRKVLKSYIFQIDSLNQTNKALQEENQSYKKKVSTMQSSYTQLEEVKKELQNKVDIASKLETFNMEASTMNSNGRKTSKHSRTSKISICFTIQKNITAEVGEKDIFLRILRPDGALLFHSRDDVFSYEGENINYSAMRTVEYGGEELDVCIFYNVDAGELTEGVYTADIFGDGYHIGNMTFNLK